MKPFFVLFICFMTANGFAQEQVSNLPVGWTPITEQEVNEEVQRIFAEYVLKEPTSGFQIVALEDEPKLWLSGNAYWSLAHVINDSIYFRVIGFARAHPHGDSPVNEETNTMVTFDQNGEVADRFYIVEKQPMPEGGLQAYYQYIQKNLKYPKEARRAKIQGRVLVQFVVDRDGSIIDVEVIQGIGGGCDEAAAKVIAEGPKWVPGEQKGKKVKVRMIMPITFHL